MQQFATHTGFALNFRPGYSCEVLDVERQIDRIAGSIGDAKDQ